MYSSVRRGGAAFAGALCGVVAMTVVYSRVMRRLSIALLVVAGCAGPGLRSHESAASGRARAPAPPAARTTPAARATPDSASDEGVATESPGETVDAGIARCAREETAIAAEIRKRIGKIYDVERLERPRDALDDVEPARALVNEMLCHGSAAAAAARADVEAWATRLEQWIALEEKCRASAACLGGRIRDALCDMVYDRREIVDRIARTKAAKVSTADALMAPALSERWSSLDARMVKSKTQFKTILHRSFDEHSCPKRYG